MVKGIGIDIVETARFQSWHTYSFMQLKKIYSEEEMDYCLSSTSKSAERFAVRFSAKEAFLKALTHATGNNQNLLKVCRAVSIVPNDKIPQVSVDWEALGVPHLEVHFSLSHNKSTAVAMIVLEKN